MRQYCILSLLDIDLSPLSPMHREWTMTTAHAPPVLWRSIMAPFSDHQAEAEGRRARTLADRSRPSRGWTAGRQTRTCAGKVAVSRRKTAARGRVRPAPVQPRDGRLPSPLPLSILPSYFFSGGKIIGGGQTDQWSSGGQCVVGASLGLAGVGRDRGVAGCSPAGRAAVRAHLTTES